MNMLKDRVHRATHMARQPDLVCVKKINYWFEALLYSRYCI